MLIENYNIIAQVGQELQERSMSFTKALLRDLCWKMCGKLWNAVETRKKPKKCRKKVKKVLTFQNGCDIIFKRSGERVTEMIDRPPKSA
jgi:hypothetical protein